MTDAALVSPGFSAPAHDSARSFRCILEALSRPGRITAYKVDVNPPQPLTSTLAGLMLTLADSDTRLWLDEELRSPASHTWLRFHTGARIVEQPTEPTFAIGRAAALLSQTQQLSLGTAEYPDRSTTLIVVVDGFAQGPQVKLEGPGNAAPRAFCADVDPAFWRLLQANAAVFPLGLDCIFAAPTAIAAVPRSSRVAFAGAI